VSSIKVFNRVADELAMGVFQILQSDVHAYIEHFRPNILKYDVRTPTFWYASLNFGVSKGMTLDRVLIFPNETLYSFLIDSSRQLKAPDKYYVGVTRAKFSLAFVVEELKQSEHFLEDVLNIGDIKAKVLKFRIK
jgi:DNA helicase-2/ATP-dependent DNA helicase PcrA